MFFCFLTFFLFIFFPEIEAQKTYAQRIQNLTSQILKNYNRFYRPRRNQSDPIDVGVFLLINQLDNVVKKPITELVKNCLKIG